MFDFLVAAAIWVAVAVQHALHAPSGLWWVNNSAIARYRLAVCILVLVLWC
jgi:hypothetical protein